MKVQTDIVKRVIDSTIIKRIVDCLLVNRVITNDFITISAIGIPVIYAYEKREDNSYILREDGARILREVQP